MEDPKAYNQRLIPIHSSHEASQLWHDLCRFILKGGCNILIESPGGIHDTVQPLSELVDSRRNFILHGFPKILHDFKSKDDVAPTSMCGHNNKDLRYVQSSRVHSCPKARLSAGILSAQNASLAFWMHLGTYINCQ